MEHLHCDVLVIGSGAAGLRAAIAAKEKDLDVMVVSKARPGKGTCTIVSGGACRGSEEGTSPERHVKRTLEAGRGINERDLVRVLAQEAPMRFRELMDWGIHGILHKGSLFANGRPPLWGSEIVRCLVAKNQSLGTRFMSGIVVADIKTANGNAGVIAYSLENAKWLSYHARAVVLATGGAGALYLRHDNPKRILGDGYYLALNAGAVLQDMEFVQFYPLILSETDIPSYLIPPGVADQGRLYNDGGEDLLEKYGILERPAAIRARDRLSQALFREIERNGQNVWLDLRGVSREQWKTDPFSASSWKILGERCGAGDRPVRISPMAHHVMGGVRIDTHGTTTAPGLFAAGEVTGGLHGANRMGGNALTETLVFGTRAGEMAAIWAQNNRENKDVFYKAWDSFRSESKGVRTKSDAASLLGKLRKILWEDGGIIRNRPGLIRALEEIESIRVESKTYLLEGPPVEVQRNMELRFAAETAAIILQGALRREESRGAHYREDFPGPNEEWKGHLEVQLDQTGEPLWVWRGFKANVKP